MQTKIFFNNYSDQMQPYKGKNWKKSNNLKQIAAMSKNRYLRYKNSPTRSCCLTNNLLLNDFIEKECVVLPTGKK